MHFCLVAFWFYGRIAALLFQVRLLLAAGTSLWSHAFLVGYMICLYYRRHFFLLTAGTFIAGYRHFCLAACFFCLAHGLFVWPQALFPLSHTFLVGREHVYCWLQALLFGRRRFLFDTCYVCMAAGTFSPVAHRSC